MSGRTQGPIPTKEPERRRVSLRSLTLAVGGPERPYPVYRFSRTAKIEKPRHNPFEGL